MMKKKSLGVLLTAGTFLLSVPLSGCTDIEEGVNSSINETTDAEIQTHSFAEDVTSAEETISEDSAVSDSEEDVLPSDGDSSSELSAASDPQFSELPPADSSETEAYTELTDSSDNGSGADIYSVRDEDKPPIYIAYKEVVEQYAELVSSDETYVDEYCHYSVADIDSDGVYELLAETGSIEADRTVTVYTFDGEKAIGVCDPMSLWHAQIGICGDKICMETTSFNSYILSELTLTDGYLTVEREQTPSENSQLTAELESYSFSDLSGLEQLTTLS